MRITFDHAKEKFHGAVEHFKNELSAIRAGRANPQIVENVLVFAYGQKVPLKQVANIIVVDATLINIKPWDKSNIETLYKDLVGANLGINPTLDGDTIKLPVPQLTQERRQEYIKMMKNKLEEARISVRQIRKDILVGIENQFSKNELSEDEKKSIEKRLQDLVEQVNLEIENLAKDKELELTTV